METIIDTQKTVQLRMLADLNMQVAEAKAELAKLQNKQRMYSHVHSYEDPVVVTTVAEKIDGIVVTPDSMASLRRLSEINLEIASKEKQLAELKDTENQYKKEREERFNTEHAELLAGIAKLQSRVSYLQEKKRKAEQPVDLVAARQEVAELKKELLAKISLYDQKCEELTKQYKEISVKIAEAEKKSNILSRTQKEIESKQKEVEKNKQETIKVLQATEKYFRETEQECEKRKKDVSKREHEVLSRERQILAKETAIKSQRDEIGRQWVALKDKKEMFNRITNTYYG